MLRTASSLPHTGLLTLGSDPARFPAEPPACYRASWQLPGPDFHRQATTSLRTRRNTMALRHGVTSRSAGRTKKVHCVMALRATLDCDLSRINLAPVGRMARTGRPELGCSIKAAATTLCYKPDRTWVRQGICGAAHRMRSERGILLTRHHLHQGCWGGAEGYVFDHERPVSFGRDHTVGVYALIGGCRVVVVSSGDDGIGFRLDRYARVIASLEGGRVRWGGELEQGHLDAVACVVAVVGHVVAADKMEAGGISPVLVEIGGAHRPVVHVGGLRQGEPGWGRNDLCTEPPGTGRPVDRAAPRRRAGRRCRRRGRCRRSHR